MVSAVDTVTFQNKKPKLFGEITVDNTTIKITDVQSGDSACFTQPPGSGTSIIEDVTITVTKIPNRIHLRAEIRCRRVTSTDADLVLQEDGSGDLGSTPLTAVAGRVIVEGDVVDASIGNHTYGYRIINNDSGTIEFCQSTGSTTNEAHFMMATLTEFTDTHDVKNANIING